MFPEKAFKGEKSSGQKGKAFHSAFAVCRFCYGFLMFGTIGTAPSDFDISKIIMEFIGCSLESCQCGSLLWHRMPLVRFCADPPLSLANVGK